MKCFIKNSLPCNKSFLLIFCFTAGYYEDSCTSFNMQKTVSRSVKIGVVHSCPYCKYSTTYSTALKRHIVVHTKEKPFVCNICFKSYTQKKSLQMHEISHLKL